MVLDRPLVHDAAVDSLLTTLEIEAIALTECAVSPGWRLSFAPIEVPGLHYALRGQGQLVVGEKAPIPLAPHSLVVVPPQHPYRLEAPRARAARQPLREKVVQLRPGMATGLPQRIVAGDDEPAVTLICGLFRARYGGLVEIFPAASAPLAERFDDADELTAQLRSVVAELAAPRRGTTAMTAALLKQVVVTLLRRRLRPDGPAPSEIALLGDPAVARAFADMAARPGAAHSLSTLSDGAGLSRSAFVMRFSRAVGRAPMTALRDLRMRRAADLLAAGGLSVDEVARAVGYASRSSFSRAFRAAQGSDPSAFRRSRR